MDREPKGTKLALILAAGELFAEHGLDGGSVRDIIEKADANIAAVSYHFGGKEGLFIEAVLHAFTHGGKVSDSLAIPGRAQSPEGLAAAIRETVHWTSIPRRSRSVASARYSSRSALRYAMTASTSAS